MADIPIVIPSARNVKEAETELLKDIMASIYKQEGVLTVATILGILRIAEMQLIEEQE